jgi:hypothetical protein
VQQIDNLSDTANQTSQVVLPDASVAAFTLTYLAATQRWQLDVSYGSFTVFGINLCVGANVLEAWSKVLPFGLACSSSDGVDPIYIQDFVGVGGGTPRVALYVLSADEVEAVAAGSFG